MMTWLISTALRQRIVVLALALVLVIFGVQAARNTPLDVFPEFAPPLVEIQTEAPGLSTEEVESLISVPLESAVNGVPWLKTLRSKSVLGLSSVVLIFEPGTDVIRARQLVQERITVAAAQLPSLAHAPVMLSPLSSTSRAMKIGVSSPTLDQMALSDLALWTIRPRLMAVPGVANVAIWGQRDRQYQVIIDPRRLAASGVTIAEVVKAAGDATVVSGGGFVDTPNQRLPVQHLTRLETAEDLGRTVVKASAGAAIRIADVAEVRIGHPAPIGDAVINDGPGLLLIVEKQPWGNTLEVTRKVEVALDGLRPGLKGVEVDSTIFRPATFIEDSLRNLGLAMALGSILVAVVIFAFTANWRPAVISLTAIPLSLLAAALVLHQVGGTLNVMVIAGLVIALGEIVDDAIIDVENISRRLRLNAQAPAPRSSFDVVLKASLEVRSAVVFASLIVMLVFLPVFFLGGLGGVFFRPLASAYVLAIAASLLVALTVTPALCLLLLPRGAEHRGDPRWLGGLKARYRAILPRFAGLPARASAGALAVMLGLAALGSLAFKEQFLPDFKERDFLMHWVEKPGTSLEAMRRITVQASKELRAVPGVRNFGSHIGRAEVADEVVGPNFTELWISLDAKAPYDATVAKVQAVVDGYPGLYRDLLTYLRERIKEVLTGASATVVVRVYGPDMAVLRAKADEIKGVMATVPGVTTLKVEQQVLIPQIQVRLRPEAAAAFGLTPADIRQTAGVVVAGVKVGEVFQSQRSYDVAVWGAEAARHDPQALRSLPIRTPSGAQVPLGDVADVVIAPAPNEIKREAGSRRIDITCNVSGSDLGAVARAVEAKVGAVGFAQGYHPEFLGEYKALQESKASLYGIGTLCFLGILVLLYAEFKSLRLMTLIAVSLPFALLGGVAAVLLSGGVMSLGSLVGFVTVLGIAARNGIMLISHYDNLQRDEGMAFGLALVVRGAEERLAPILMTASCAGLALLPLVVRGDAPGHEIEHPMAVVILGGLVTSTLLNLFLLPALYAAFGRPAEART